VALLAGALCAALLAAPGAALASPVTAPVARRASAAPWTGSVVLGGQMPAVVAHGDALALGARAPSSTMKLNIDLAVRDGGELSRLIAAAGTPGSQSYGDYLTRAQYRARFAPTAAQLAAVESWLAGEHLEVSGVSADNLLVHVRASTALVEHAFGTAIEDYRAGDRSFYANDRDPGVPAGLDIDAVSGLSDYLQAEPAQTCFGIECGFGGAEFRTAYGISGSGEGQEIGFTLWGEELHQSDLDEYARETGTTPITIGASGADGLTFIPVEGASTDHDSDEIALDTENAHAVAPGVHETYWLGANNEFTTLETVLDEAASSTVPVISNSWGALTECEARFPGIEAVLQEGAATGKTFYFSTGDGGAKKGCNYPAYSQYAVAVGGTELEVGPGGEWQSETALHNGGGCTTLPRPSWQTGIGSTVKYPSTACKGRAIPDVSADSCGSTHEGSGFACWSYVFVNGGPDLLGGTSLAAPLWAAASVLWNANNAAAGRPSVGFAAPLIYSLATDPVTYARDFHDVTSGTNGFAARPGWDEASGWGSFNFANITDNTAELIYRGPSAATAGKRVTLSATLLDQGSTHGLKGRQVSFAVGGESCSSITRASGEASCTVLIGDAPGEYSVSASWPGEAAYQPASVEEPFAVQARPVVTSVSPASGPATGGTTVTITGSGFGAGAVVRVSQGSAAPAIEAGSVEVISPNEIIAVTGGPAKPGNWNLQVSTSAGTSASSTSDDFRYVSVRALTPGARRP
jgi:kumamolisin